MSDLVGFSGYKKVRYIVMQANKAYKKEEITRERFLEILHDSEKEIQELDEQRIEEEFKGYISSFIN